MVREEKVRLQSSSDFPQRAEETPIADRPDTEIKAFIEHSSLVWRFCFYGAIKNLQFFEAYLLLILLDWGYNLFEIGMLSALMHAVTYVFEVPSGVIADVCGKKNSLLLSFVFYMVSFGFYSFGASGLGLVAAATLFYGLGEAFRSGTHKAMMMVWLDRHGLGAYKTFLYSRTRSYSNMGSAANALLSVALVLLLHTWELVFLVSVLPFVADFVLVASYPAYMNVRERDASGGKGVRMIVAETSGALRELMADPAARRRLVASACFQSVFATLKHYVQPIVRERGTAILGTNVASKVLVGALYALFYAASAVGTRHSHRLGACVTDEKGAMDALFNALLVVVVAVGVALMANAPAATLPLYLVLYVLHNLWKPWGVAAIADLMGKRRRATLLSVDSLLTTLFSFGLAPVAGGLAHAFSVDAVFLGLGAAFLILHNAALAGSDESHAHGRDGERTHEERTHEECTHEEHNNEDQQTALELARSRPMSAAAEDSIGSSRPDELQDSAPGGKVSPLPRAEEPSTSACT